MVMSYRKEFWKNVSLKDVQAEQRQMRECERFFLPCLLCCPLDPVKNAPEVAGSEKGVSSTHDRAK